MTPWAALAMNGLLGALTLLTVFSIGRRLWDAETAAGAALLWSVSYGALITASEARPYVLSALLSALLLRIALAVQDRDGRPSAAQAVSLVVVMALGLLTHYAFPLFIAALGAGVMFGSGGSGRPRLLALVPLPLVALGLFAWLHPGFLASLERQRLQAQPFTVDDLLPRLERFLISLGGLARPGRAAPALAWVSAGLVAWVGLRALRAGALARLPGAWSRLRGAAPGVALVGWTALAYVALQAMLYLGHATPGHAVGGRYNAALWPMAALLIAGATRELSRDRGALPLLALATALLSWQVAWGLDQSQQRLVASPAWRALGEARLVVADHDQRGVLPRSVRHVPAQTPLWIVHPGADIGLAAGAWSHAGAPVTFVLDTEHGDAQVRAALEHAAAAGDSVVSAGWGPGGVEVVVWTPPVRSEPGAAR